MKLTQPLGYNHDLSAAELDQLLLKKAGDLAAADELAALVPDGDLLRAYRKANGVAGDCTADMLKAKSQRRGLGR